MDDIKDIENTEQVVTETEAPVRLLKDMLPEDLLEVKALNNYLDKPIEEALPEIVKSYRHAQSLIGKRVDELPVEELKDLLPRLERPETADDYVSKLAPEFGEEFVGKYKEELFELGLNETQAESYLKRHRASIEEKQHKSQESTHEAIEASEKALKDRFGLKYKVAMDMAARAALKLGGTDLYKKVFESEVKDPDMVNLLYKVGRETIAPEVAIGDPGGSLNSPGEARAQLDKLKADPEYSRALLDRHHPKHSEFLQKRDRLFKEIYG
jgi:hypothetical protein